MALLRTLPGSDGQPGDAPATRAVMLSEMEQAAPLLSVMQFYAMSGNADTVSGASELTGIGESRTLNNDYTAATSSQADRTATLRIYGDKIKTDLALTRRGYTIEGLRLSDARSFARSFGRHLQNHLFNANNVAPNVNGLYQQITGGQTIELGAGNGDTIPTGNSSADRVKQAAFLEKLDELVEMVPGGADVLVMDAQVIARLKAIAREYISVQRVQDVYGREQVVQSYNEVPIIRAGFASDGTTRVLPFTETVGTSTTCGSVWALKFGERENLTIPTSNGLNVKDLGLVGIQYVTLAELDWQVLVQNDKAIARLEGLLLA